jgi:hypothetical protein
MSQGSKHVEGRVALKFHGIEDAAFAASILLGLLHDADEWVAEGLIDDDFFVEIVQTDLYQVTEEVQDDEDVSVLPVL